jgi:hypothetical protein
MKFTMRLTSAAVMLFLVIAGAEIAPADDIYWGGFVEGLWGGRLDENNPTGEDYTASETRLQLRAETFGRTGEAFARVDFLNDALAEKRYDWELREAYVKFRVPGGFDFKVGRQILTWGTGDLIFINDVFAKDYVSFFIGRQDQYLKAPQTGIRVEWYASQGSFSLVFLPEFEPNTLPTGRRLSYYNPLAMGITGFNPDLPAPVEPELDFDNAEVAFRYARTIDVFQIAGYAYRGFYKDPRGMRPASGDPSAMIPYYPRLNVYGASVRGQVWGGIVWAEGGYYDSRDDRDGDNFAVENSSTKLLAGYEKQVATDFTGNIQVQTEIMASYNEYEASYDAYLSMLPVGTELPKADEVRTLLTSRWTKMLKNQTVILSLFGFYSPSDEDAYVRFSTEYKYSDELSLMAGGNVFTGKNDYTLFGQFEDNDNLYMKINYGF